MKGTSRIAACLLVLGLSVGAATAQSLAELSKKEKERRARLKGRATAVVTNEDLKFLTKREAVTVHPAGGPPLEEVLPPTEEAPVEEAGGEAPPAAPDFSGQPFAKTILTSTSLVADAGAALGGPDGAGALIAYGGYLDLAIDVKNGEGPDLAVYAQRPEEGILPETMLFFVFVPDGEGEWSNIGTGTGTGGRERISTSGSSSPPTGSGSCSGRSPFTTASSPRASTPANTRWGSTPSKPSIADLFRSAADFRLTTNGRFPIVRLSWTA